MNDDLSDAVAVAFKKGSDAAFSLEQALLDDGDESNAALADQAVQNLLQAATDANAQNASRRLADTVAHAQVISQLTAKLNAAADHISADEAAVHKWVSVATNATQLVSKVGTGDLGGAITNAQAIVELLS